MTEEEWEACAHPIQMLTFLNTEWQGRNRKFRLFAVACCRRIWSGLQDERSRKAVETAERFADGLATLSELRAAFNAAYDAVDDCLEYSPFSEDQAIAAFLTAARNINESTSTVPQFEDALEVAAHVLSYAIDGEIAGSEKQQAVLLRDIFNPFHPISLDPTWQTSTVLALAQGIYQDRAFDRLPILADALQDASCDNPDLLNHLRSEGPHTRGCWALDLCLNRE